MDKEARGLVTPSLCNGIILRIITHEALPLEKKSRSAEAVAAFGKLN